jgi:hypothetical protein
LGKKKLEKKWRFYANKEKTSNEFSKIEFLARTCLVRFNFR